MIILPDMNGKYHINLSRSQTFTGMFRDQPRSHHQISISLGVRLLQKHPELAPKIIDNINLSRSQTFTNFVHMVKENSGKYQSLQELDFYCSTVISWKHRKSISISLGVRLLQVIQILLPQTSTHINLSRSQTFTLWDAQTQILAYQISISLGVRLLRSYDKCSLPAH